MRKPHAGCGGLDAAHGGGDAAGTAQPARDELHGGRAGDGSVRVQLNARFKPLFWVGGFLYRLQTKVGTS